MKTIPCWLEDHEETLPSLRGSVTADAVVIGAGIAGLTVAQLLSRRGMRVAVVERATCGSGATGRSSGFITPDSELQVAQLMRRFGASDAGRLWRAASSACEHLRSTIRDETLACDALDADSAYVANGASGVQTIESEHDSRRECGFDSTYSASVSKILGASGFDAVVRYSGTFAMTPYRYAIGLRDVLRSRGVQVFEHSEVVAVDGGEVATEHGTIRADRVFFCADRDLASVGDVRSTAYFAQTFLAATGPLAASVFDSLFPDGDLLVWDTDLIYHYFRRTADDRLLLGGGHLRDTYGPPRDGTAGVDALRTYVREHLPALAEVPFANAWSGLIGVTKDLLPVAGRDRRQPRHFYAGCAAGIPWSVLAAKCAVEVAIDHGSELERFFDPQRSFTDLDPVQPLLRKPLTFALSHAYAKGALRGTAEQVRRRRPFVAGILIAGLFAFARIVRRLFRARS